MKKIKEWLALLMCCTLLAACGGGGGSPGSNGNGATPSKAASVLLVASSGSIPSSGADGTEVALTAIVKDASNNVLPNETVSFKADSGNISNTVRVTDANGVVTEKLNVKGDSTVRTITVTASVGSVTSAPVRVMVVNAVSTLSLSADSGVLQSAGAAGSEVTLVALVKDANNNVVPGVKVDLASDSGSLSATNRITDAKGMVTEKLSTGGDPTSRSIKVTASVANAAPVTTIINVAGTRVQINASSTVAAGASTDVTVKVTDSAGNALNNRPVAFSSGANGLRVKDNGPAATNAAGQLVLTYTAIAGGSDVITVRALGETASAPILISSARFSVNAVNGAGSALSVANINVCQPVAIYSDNGGVPQTGTVSLSSSRGAVYKDAGCSVELKDAGPLTLVGGAATGYVRASGPGVATLTATTSANGVTAQGTVEFVAPLTADATVRVQADPAVLGVNTAGSAVQQTTLRAVVRDGTPEHNLVKNAQVAFSIVTDPSGGALTQPSVVTTGSDGSATVGYIAGTTDTKVDGVQIAASVAGAPAARDVVALTVAKRSLFITAGTGNTVATPNPATYQVDYSVFVTDAAGNPVPGVSVTGSVLPKAFYKGKLYFLGTEGPWAPAPADAPLLAPFACPNEDVDRDGQLSGGEDTNGNGRLDPGIPVTVTPAVTTDARGQATVSLAYPRDRANWLDVELTIRGQVSGSEARYVGLVHLIGLSADYSTLNVTPPGLNSPYGTNITLESPAGSGTQVRNPAACSNPN